MAVIAACSALGPEAIKESPWATAREMRVNLQVSFKQLLNIIQMVLWKIRGAGAAARCDTL